MKQILKKLFTLNFEEWRTLFNETMHNHQFGETEAIILIIAIVIVAIFVYKFFYTVFDSAFPKIIRRMKENAHIAYAPLTWWLRWPLILVLEATPLILAIMLVMFIDINVFALIG